MKIAFWPGALGKLLLFCILVSLAASAAAGDLDSPAGPLEAGSEMVSIEAIYDRLDTGAAGAATVFTEPLQGPTAGTGRTLNEVMSKAPAVDASSGAYSSQVLSGKTYWGLRAGEWGQRAGTMPNIGAQDVTPGPLPQTIAAGWHNGAGEVAGDPDLVSGNIRAGVDVFGVAGDPSVVDTASGDAQPGDLVMGKTAWSQGTEIQGTLAPAAVIVTGQKTSYASGDDGDKQAGAAPAASRFTLTGDGTVTDNLTGLVWLQQANYTSTAGSTATVSWADALAFCNALQNGQCGLSDGSSPGDWRMPNRFEMESLLDLGRSFPSVPLGHPFSNIRSSAYWTSTTYAPAVANAWWMYFTNGTVGYGDKSGKLYVWPVRDAR